MQHPSDADRIRKHSVDTYIEPARARGDATVSIVAGDVHKMMHLRNRVPAVCQALKSGKFLEENGLVLEKLKAPPSGQSTTAAFTYRFKDFAASKPEWPFLRLRGVAKEIFADLGGGEEFLRKEREQFSQSPPGTTDKQ